MNSSDVTGRAVGITLAGLLVTSCAASVSTPGNANVGNLTDVDSTNDPNRIVCKSYKPEGWEKAEKICMTAGQWDKKDGETK